MKHINWLPLFFIFFTAFSLSAQSASKVVLVSKGISEYHPVKSLPIDKQYIRASGIPKLPIHKAPDSFEKHYLIRVHQSDERIFHQFLPSPTAAVLYSRGVDHKGYDYFLSMPFEKKEQAELFLQHLKGSAYSQAIVVKKLPKKVKCNCFSRM